MRLEKFIIKLNVYISFFRFILVLYKQVFCGIKTYISICFVHFLMSDSWRLVVYLDCVDADTSTVLESQDFYSEQIGSKCAKLNSISD